jgi:ATP-dependent DNA helicase RecQ
MCFQMIPLVSKDRPCIVISPLISLQNDQVASLRARGIRACALNAHNGSGARDADDAFSGRMQLVYMAPERLGSALPRLLHLEQAVGISAFAIDEGKTPAHIIQAAFPYHHFICMC